MQYTIQKGNHRSGYFFEPLLGKSVMYGKFCFHPNCLYDVTNMSHLNKLVGFCNMYHHYQSVRLAWRPGTDGYLIELWHYAYQGWRNKYRKLAEVVPDRTYEFELRIKFGYTLTKVKGGGEPKNKVIAGPTWEPVFGYTLFPYFGGHPTAPQRMSLDLNYELR